jgi:tripartite-type tricarboxylate transporter receptor subunit TctC
MSGSRICRLTIVAVALGIPMLAVSGQAAEDDAYRGRNINLIVSTDAGTGYDVYARTIARHWQRHIPGTPSITVQNMAGAGGLRAANLLFNVSPKDGLTLGLVQSTVPFEPLFGNRQAIFDPRRFNWLGTPGQETSTVIVWHSVPVQTIQDAKKRGLTLAATGRASTPAFYARVITALLGVPINLIAGYKSQNEIFISMERGEHEGSAGTFYSTLKASKSDWLSDGKIRVLLQYGSKPNPELKGVPFALDLIADAQDRQIMEIASAPLALGRPLLAPPGVSPERLVILRRSLSQTFADPAYLADCERQSIACDTALSGETLAAILAKSYEAPDTARQRLVAIYDASAN